MRALVVFAILAAAVHAQPGPRVTTKVTPPFVLKTETTPPQWSGLAIELWHRIAARVPGLAGTAQFDERPLSGMLDAVAGDGADIAVGAITITAEREERVDFTQPFLTSGIGIATHASGSTGFLAVLDRVFSWDLLQAVGGLVLLLFILGAAVWVVERRNNPEQFGGGIKGVGEGFWWSAVTMTTVGYGDRAPVTFAGRAIAFVWMFASIIVISSYTASIASALTVSQLQGAVQGPEDLPHVRVATARGTSSADWLEEHGIAFRGEADVAAALNTLAEGRVDAVVYDIPILHDIARTNHPGEVEILPDILREEAYAFALPPESPLREEVNRAVAEIVRTNEWMELRRRYLGD